MTNDANGTSDANSTAAKSPWLNWKLLAVGVPVTLGFLYFAAPKEPDEWRQLATAFRTADYRLLPAFLIVLVLFYWLKAFRWRLLLAPLGNFPTTQLVPSMMIGFGVNNVVPAHLGELVRVGVFWKQSKVPFSSVLSTVALERLFDLIAILSLLGVGLVLVEGLDPTIKQLGLLVAAVTAAGVAGAALYVFFTQHVLALVRWTFRILPLPEKLEEKVLSLAESGAAGLKAIRSPGLLTAVISVSFAKWILNGVLAWLALYAFDMQISAAMSFVLLGAIALAVTIPSTPGYFGVIQATFWVVLQTQPELAERKADVFAASIFYHMAQWLPVTIIGLGYFVKSGLSLGDFTTRPHDASTVENGAAAGPGELAATDTETTSSTSA